MRTNRTFGQRFRVLDPRNEYLVEVFPTEEAAKNGIAECMKEDAQWETAKLLVDIATKEMMQRHDLDREIASRLIRDAMGG